MKFKSNGRLSAKNVASLKRAPFRVIGYADGVFYFMSRAGHTVQKLPQLDRRTMNELAPNAYWKKTYPGRRGRIDWLRAISHLTSCAFELGQPWTTDRTAMA